MMIKCEIKRKAVEVIRFAVLIFPSLSLPLTLIEVLQVQDTTIIILLWLYVCMYVYAIHVFL
jgi:hypothetical protein